MTEQEEILFGCMTVVKEAAVGTKQIQAAVDDTLKKLPGAARQAIQEEAGKTLGQAAQGAVAQLETVSARLAKTATNFSETAAATASEIRGSSAALRQSGFIVAGVIVVVALVVSAAAWKVMNWRIETQTVELAELKNQAAIWEQKAGKAKLNTCGEAKRLCVRINEKAGVYGKSGEQWMVIDGY